MSAQHGRRGSATASANDPLASTFSDLVPHDGIDVREGYADVGDATLHYVEAGGSIAWTTAMNHPEVVDRLVILNAAHPRRLSEGLHHPNQLRKSWYFFFFAIGGLPEDVVHARDWHFFRHFLHEANPPYSPEEIERYIDAWSQPGAASGMINYYRASVRQSQKEAVAKLRPISAPTLVIWGARLLPRLRPRRAQQRSRSQPRPRGTPRRRVPLGAS